MKNLPKQRADFYRLPGSQAFLLKAYAGSLHGWFVVCRCGRLPSVRIWNVGRCVDTLGPSSLWAIWRPAGSRLAASHAAFSRSGVLPLALLRLVEWLSASFLQLEVLRLEAWPLVGVRLVASPSAAELAAIMRLAALPSAFIRYLACIRIQRRLVSFNITFRGLNA